MRIVVLVKHVPDATGERRFAPDRTVDRSAVDNRLSELDEYAVEQALRIAESGVEAEITYLTMGPEPALQALRKALSMGGDRAVHVVDAALHGTDYLATSRVLAAAVERAGFDLVLAGMASTDGYGSVIPAMLAERLGVAQATMAGEVTVTDGTLRIRRDGDLASTTVTASLPAVVSVTDQSGEARYPSFKGIMAAKKKPVETWSLTELGIDAAEVGLAGASTVVERVEQRPPRQAGEIVRDEGQGGVQLAAYLAGQKFL